MSLLTSSTLFPFFCPLLPVDAFLPGRVVLTRGLFPHSDRPCAVFFFCFFLPVATSCSGLFFLCLFFPVAISCAGFFVFCLFFSGRNLLLWFSYFLSFSVCFVCYVCCVYSYNVWLVIMNMGCRSMICMIGYCHCQFVREGGARLVGQLVTLCSMHQR